MNHDPLASIKRLEDTFGNLNDIFAQYRKRVLKIHAEQQFELSARNEHIKVLNGQLERAQMNLDQHAKPDPASVSLGKALEMEKSRNRELSERNRILQSKIEILQKQILADRDDVKDILKQLEEVFAELENA